MSEQEYDLIIIGGGPAGMTAGLYASRAELKTLLVEKMIMGGQMMTATLVENWPGYPGGIDGPELMMRFQKHCVEFGLETGSPVALVRDQRGAFGVEAGERDHVEAGVAFVGFGAGQRERQGQTAGRGDQMQSQSPEET